ncbi:PIR protein [Plasmodium ovale]|uniref:PIR protein n=1 Tax=Plasmodium ovale TaxID=36330 RepID=A0A1C3KHT2_PLAOA|nr:PIR protein [Plasmodium ovale]
MSAGIPQTGLAKLFGYTPKELYSEHFYQERELPYLDLHNYSIHCNEVIVKGEKGHVRDLCKRVLKYLKESRKYQKPTSGYDECILLNYWIYDDLDKYYKHNTENMNIAYAGIEKIWNNLVNDSYQRSYYQKCVPLFKSILDHDDWKKRKELYDYCINYELIGQMSKFIDEKCMQYYGYIEEKAELYDHFEKECLSHPDTCPEFYNKCKDYKPEKVLDTLICHEKIKAKKVAALQNSQRQAPESGPHASGTDLTQENSQIGTKFGHTVLGVAPVLVAASALYRYTPVGSWILKLGGYNQNNVSNMNGEELDGFLSNAQGSDGMFFGGGENYISYQPM